MKKFLPGALCLFLIMPPVLAQEILVKDINTSVSHVKQSSDYTNTFCNCGEYLYFPAETSKGKELWRTDGTAEGTIMVQDIYYGRANGIVGDILCSENRTLFFTANNGQHGTELWASDGTTEGTRLIKDITPGAGGFVSILGILGNTVFVLADHNQDGSQEIWKSDGTAANTIMVSVIENFPSSARMFSDTHLFFYAAESGKNILWSSDGTSGNATKILENKTIRDFSVFGNTILFAAQDRSTGEYSLWSTDGTTSGTNLVHDFGLSFIQQLHRFNDKLIFSSSGSTWISDGTPGGTTFLTTGFTDAGAVIADIFYGLGYDASTSSMRLYKTDGVTLTGVNLDGDSNNLLVNAHLPSLNDKLFLQYYDEDLGTELGISDTDLNFALLKDINLGAGSSEPRDWAVFKNRIYFFADDGERGTELWCTDGTGSGTFLFKEIAQSNSDAFLGGRNMTVSGGKLQMLALTSPAPYTSLYTSDGTAEGTFLKFDFGLTVGASLIGKTSTDLIYWSDSRFFKTNGVTEDVTLIKDLTGEVFGWGISSEQPHTLENKTLFVLSTTSPGYSTGNEFWVSDGTGQGTHMLKDINPGPANGAFGNGATVQSKVIFDGNNGSFGSELWSTDGTEDGTILVKDINVGIKGSAPVFFTTFKDRAVFSALEPTHGREAWITDGTSQGTIILADLVPGTESSEPRGFTCVGDQVFFTAYDALRGWCVWKTNGTTAGTVFVKDIDIGANKTNMPTNFATAKGKFYFTADDGIHGMELWVSDGTETGTHVIDLLPGAAGSPTLLLTPIHDVMYFKSQAALWRTNGTLDGTSKVSDIEPMEIEYIDNWIYFTASHPEYGIELFKIEFTQPEDPATGIEDEEDPVSFYPNPARETLYISVGHATDAQLTIIDLQGKPVDSYQLQRGEIVQHSLAGYARGLYLAQVVTEKGISYRKFIKE